MKLSELKKAIMSFIKNSEDNVIPELGGIKIYEEPIIAVASADDPLFLKLKDEDVIGAFHKTPKEWFPEAVSVISYYLPYSESIHLSNRKNKTIVSQEWLYGRVEGEALNDEVKKFIARFLNGSGGKFSIPTLDPDFLQINTICNWSERHTAYIAGLGTFGLHNSLITKKGCAGRFGSVITDLKFPVSKRSYTGIYEYCSECMECAERCPVNAISENGKDHRLCYDNLVKIWKVSAPRYGCGKCLTNVPCESRIPK